MTNLQLSKSELQQIILWGERYKDKSEEVGIPFEEDELRLLDKLKKLREIIKPKLIKRKGVR